MTKRVESVWFPRLDEGSTPSSSTLSTESHEQRLFEKNPLTGVRNNTIVVAAICSTQLPDATHINILLHLWRSTLHNRRAEAPFHTRADNHLPIELEHSAARHHKRLFGTPFKPHKTHLAGSTQRNEPRGYASY